MEFKVKYRHGDMVLVKIDRLPEDGITKSDQKVLMTGRHNNPHSINEGEVYFVDNVGLEDFVIGYLKTTTANPILYHPNHGKSDGAMKEAEILPGIYEIRRQIEYTHDGMRQITD